MNKKVDLNSIQTSNKINLNNRKNKSILLTINLNNKPQEKFKLKTRKIGRKPSTMKYKKQVEEGTQIEGRPYQEIEEFVEFDDENDDETDDDEIEEEDDDSTEEDTNESLDNDKLKEQLEKGKNHQSQNDNQQKNKPEQNTNTMGNQGTNVSNSASPPATTPTPAAPAGTTAGGTAAGGTSAGGTSAGGTAAGGTAAGGTAAGGGLVAAAPYIGIALIIILVIVVIIAVIIVVFSGAKANSSGNYAYGQTCTKVTVINTDCDSNNQNCTNKYNGDVETEDYIAGVVAAESQGNTNPEYLKLLSVAVRTNFIENVDDNCIVEGNSNFLNYMDVNASSNSSEVKQAVSETKNFITISNDKLVKMEYGYGNIVNEDSTNYYISYGIATSGGEQLQTIPKSWADNQTMFKDYLSNWEKSNEAGTKLSLIGSLYLISNENYTYENVIEYYYGEEVKVSENTMILSGINGYMNPTRYINCTSPFGNRIHPVNNTTDFHGGLDIGISGGEPIYAAKDGIVSTVVKNVSAINECSYGYGNYVIIDHGDGTKTLYSHMKYGSIPSDIFEGAEVKQGQQVGEVGSTGCSTGNHLHYEVRINDEQVDPADYLDLTGATGTCRN